MRIRRFESQVWLPLSPKELFPFFADAGNLDAITPDWLHFQMVTPPPIEMREGALIDYRLRLWGVPIRWRTRINVWQPPHQFVDEQVLGPYRQWIHTHTFEPRDGGTLALDLVQYAVPFDLVVNPFVRRDVVRIFRYRNDALQKRFGNANSSQ